MPYGWIYHIEAPTSVPHNSSFLIKFRIFCIFLFFRKITLHIWIKNHHDEYVAYWKETIHPFFFVFRRYSRTLSMAEDTVFTIYLGYE